MSMIILLPLSFFLSNFGVESLVKQKVNHLKGYHFFGERKYLSHTFIIPFVIRFFLKKVIQKLKKIFQLLQIKIHNFCLEINIEFIIYRRLRNAFAEIRLCLGKQAPQRKK